MVDPVDKYRGYCTIGVFHTDSIRSYWRKVRCSAPTEIEEGEDRTWTGTDLTDIQAVYLFHNGYTYGIETPDSSPGEFWQSDDYEAVVGEQPVLIRRRIQLKVEESWLTLEVEDERDQYKIYLADRRI